MKVELMRVKDADNRGSFNRWLIFDKKESMWGKRGESKIQLMDRWNQTYGDGDMKITGTMRYTGIARVSEAVATISEYQEGTRP